MENVVNGGEPPVNEDVGENAPVVINDNGVQAVGELSVVINQTIGRLLASGSSRSYSLVQTS
ncbi:hypothetical protein M8C21_012482 [Ambrosia artemisiifolia]|uniref:Uncharacterized protein n=1 Tax=Ambrosia artemisiifolia TaxID=4212 RepID=A0AAD5CVX6_AMBAR|nr:hypothetical protein M8C21_012482 [Ambrosia artemisiifolia]